MTMTDDELELKILQRFVEQHAVGGAKAPGDKSAQELDMRQVIRELTGKEGPDLDYHVKFWFQRLVVRPSAGVPVAPLRPGKSGEPFRARAFMAGTATPAWDRIRQLQREIDSNTQPSHFIIIQDSVVAGLNLGTVIGSMQSTLVSLEHIGNPELATSLKRLTEEVATTEALGDKRRDVIESLSAIGEQALLPGDQRKPSVVKALLAFVAASLRGAANLAKIWQTVSLMIARFFGLPSS